MKMPKAKATMGSRILALFVGLLLLWGLVSGVYAGDFKLGGEPYLSVDHPIGFWSYALFLAFSVISLLYIAAFGEDDSAKH
ncbi:hypothetical protein GCM10023115_17810 [Pontixanthobacter gangjinensis]|uniref:DUF997 family protein n=1 Tax=Pontixanthobacter gangjinensis TaxID=1028742 RepID=A0A6I4SPM9_9SPHN|nr:hypothetical protein [Pontixanthobacter gangjinensis]MXO57026.1 hypothetical protein [Pontixanthobacter gangjinensis]